MKSLPQHPLSSKSDPVAPTLPTLQVHIDLVAGFFDLAACAHHPLFSMLPRIIYSTFTPFSPFGKYKNKPLFLEVCRWSETVRRPPAFFYGLRDILIIRLPGQPPPEQSTPEERDDEKEDVGKEDEDERGDQDAGVFFPAEGSFADMNAHADQIKQHAQVEEQQQPRVFREA